MKQDDKLYQKQMSQIAAYAKIYHYFAKNAAIVSASETFTTKTLEFVEKLFLEFEKIVDSSSVEIQFKEETLQTFFW
jgi:cell shape-determining protein MreC